MITRQHPASVYTPDASDLKRACTFLSFEKEPIIWTPDDHTKRNRTGGPRDGACRYPGPGTAMQLSPLFRSLSLQTIPGSLSLCSPRRWATHVPYPSSPP